MKSKQTMALLFWRFMRKMRKEDGKVPIYARITIDGKSKEISTGAWCLPDLWNSKAKMIDASDKSASAANLRLAQVKSELESHFLVLCTTRPLVTAEMLKDVYEGAKPGQLKQRSVDEQEDAVPEHTLLEIADMFIEEFSDLVDKGKRSPETLKHWRTTRKKLAAFIAYRYKKKDFPLELIKYSFAVDFLKYLTISIDEPLEEVSAMKHIKNTKQLVKTAVNKEWASRNLIEGFKCGAESPEVEPLELYEVEKLSKKQQLIPRLDEVRDAFIVQCFTGFAFQDLYNLSPEHIVRVGIDGERWLVKKRGKTNVTEMVPILPIVEELIEKYKNHPYCRIHNRLFPVNCNARYNGYLKELAVVCDLRKDLNTHLARHTFADIMLNMNVPLEDVSKMLGHKSIRTTQRYCRVKKHRISKNMQAVKFSLFTKDGRLRKVIAA